MRHELNYPGIAVGGTSAEIDRRNLRELNSAVRAIKNRVTEDPQDALRFFKHFDTQPSDDHLERAREMLLSPKSQVLHTHEFSAEARQYGAIAAFTGVFDPRSPLGLGNPYGTSLGGTRIVDIATLKGDSIDEKLASGQKLAGELAADMERKYATLIELVATQYRPGKASVAEFLACMLGGSKSVIVVDGNIFPSVKAAENDQDAANHRGFVFKEYGRFIDSLGGPITAVDMGTGSLDMDNILDSTDYVTCQSENRGGVGSPSKVTADTVFWGALGVLNAMGYYDSRISRLPVAVQGIGGVGAPLVTRWLNRFKEAKISVNDNDPAQIDKLRESLGDLNNRVITEKGDILLAAGGGILMPCAIASILSRQTLENMIQTDSLPLIVAGAANDQYTTIGGGLPDQEIVRAYHERGVTVLPAPSINLGGILRVSAGHRPHWGGDRNYQDPTRDFALAEGVYDMSQRVYQGSVANGTSMEDAYNDLITVTYAQNLAALQEFGIKV